VLAFWHPFAPALFVACYSGFYLETFSQRNQFRRILPLLMLAGVAATTVAVAVLFSRDRMPLDSRWAAFIASYRTNELNGLVSAVVLVLICLAVGSITGSRRSVMAWLVVLCAVAAVLFAAGIPLLMLWFAVVLVKLFRLRLWSLWLLMFSTALLPLGGATGTPTHILFAIIVAAFATALGWQDAEDAVKPASPYYILVPVAAAACCLVLIRSGVHVPVLSRVATPLLSERERTYQMEAALAWLRRSPYCDADLAYAVSAGSPAQSLRSAVTRENRPPADLEDVLVFWNAILRCRGGRHSSGRQSARTVVVTFGGPELHDSTPVYEVPGRYAGNATVWVSSKSATYTSPQITPGLKTERQ
jgi:MFS family permease